MQWPACYIHPGFFNACSVRCSCWVMFDVVQHDSSNNGMRRTVPEGRNTMSNMQQNTVGLLIFQDTCPVCQQDPRCPDADTFRAGSAHNARTHLTQAKSCTPTPAPPVLPSTPEAHAIAEGILNRSPPYSCSTEPPSTQELITEFLQSSPTHPFTPISPSSSAEPTPTTQTSAFLTT